MSLPHKVANHNRKKQNQTKLIPSHNVTGLAQGPEEMPKEKQAEYHEETAERVLTSGHASIYDATPR